MRNELKKRVVVVAQALKKLAGPTEMAEVNTKIKLLVNQIAEGNLTPEQVAVKKVQIAKLQKILVQMNKNSSAPDTAAL